MIITIRVHDVRVFHGAEQQGPHCRAIGYMPSGQVLIEGRICAGHAPSVQAAAVRDVADWVRVHRPGWHIETLPGEGVVGRAATGADFEIVAADDVRADEPRYWIVDDFGSTDDGDRRFLEWFAKWRVLSDVPRFDGADRAVVPARRAVSGGAS